MKSIKNLVEKTYENLYRKIIKEGCPSLIESLSRDDLQYFLYDTTDLCSLAKKLGYSPDDMKRGCKIAYDKWSGHLAGKDAVYAGVSLIESVSDFEDSLRSAKSAKQKQYAFAQALFDIGNAYKNKISADDLPDMASQFDAALSASKAY